MAQVSRSTPVAADCARVWALVSDLPSMGEYSPENVGGRWVRGGGPVVGAVLRGRNRRGWRRWTTWAHVTRAVPGESFAFRVGAGRLLTTTRWTYELVPTADGCLLTESWEDLRGPLVARLGDLFSGEHDRAGFTVRSIDQTLARVKARAEAEQAAERG